MLLSNSKCRTFQMLSDSRMLLSNSKCRTFQMLSDSRMLLLDPHHHQHSQQQQQQQQSLLAFTDSGLRARSNSTPLANGWVVNSYCVCIERFLKGRPSWGANPGSYYFVYFLTPSLYRWATAAPTIESYCEGAKPATATFTSLPNSKIVEAHFLQHL
jgi:hypothetical protein